MSIKLRVRRIPSTEIRIIRYFAWQIRKMFVVARARSLRALSTFTITRVISGLLSEFKVTAFFCFYFERLRNAHRNTIGIFRIRDQQINTIYQHIRIYGVRNEKKKSKTKKKNYTQRVCRIIYRRSATQDGSTTIYDDDVLLKYTPRTAVVSNVFACAYTLCKIRIIIVYYLCRVFATIYLTRVCVRVCVGRRTHTRTHTQVSICLYEYNIKVYIVNCSNLYSCRLCRRRQCIPCRPKMKNELIFLFTIYAYIMFLLTGRKHVNVCVCCSYELIRPHFRQHKRVVDSAVSTHVHLYKFVLTR